MEVVFLLIPISIIIIFLTIWAFVWSVENDQFENLDKEAERILSEDLVIEIPENGTEGLEVSFLPVEEGYYDIEIQTVDNFNNSSEILTFFVEVPGE